MIRAIGLGLITSLTFWGLMGRIFRVRTRSQVDRQANRYFPVQSPSEVAAGHPIVGVS